MPEQKKTDGERLIEIYFIFQELEGELHDMEFHHSNIKEFSKVIEAACHEIHQASHLLFKEAAILRKLENLLKNDENTI